ncbi:putative ubiquitinyl hydrolase 1 [Helianthus anomalus]
MQHDVQELNRILCEKFEDKIKRTLLEGPIQQLFEGLYITMELRRLADGYSEAKIEITDWHDV